MWESADAAADLRGVTRIKNGLILESYRFCFPLIRVHSRKSAAKIFFDFLLS